MPSLLKRAIKVAKRRIKSGLQDYRTWRLYMAGRELLADQDYDRIAVAKIASMAGVSVGAFYERFKSKDAFLSFLIAERFGSAEADAERHLHPDQFTAASAHEVIQSIVEHELRAFHGPMGGVVKASVKQGQLDAADLRHLHRYRAIVADRAVALLAPHLGQDSEGSVRAAVQMLHATAIDILHHDAGVLKRGRRRAADALAAMMQAYVGLPAAAAASGSGEPADEWIEIPEEFGPKLATAADIKKAQRRDERQRQSDPAPKAKPTTAGPRRLRARLV
ncbi:MAG: TetR/AcrR family transcriptional regulator [Pseudomonadota bacterium]|nr:TetR/AcrR family transcriptional regulator [Pseudomonadota bacterium]